MVCTRSITGHAVTVCTPVRVQTVLGRPAPLAVSPGPAPTNRLCDTGAADVLAQPNAHVQRVLIDSLAVCAFVPEHHIQRHWADISLHSMLCQCLAIPCANDLLYLYEMRIVKQRITTTYVRVRRLPGFISGQLCGCQLGT